MVQDSRFTDKEKKLMKELKFSNTLQNKVDMTKVNLDLIRPWISKRLTAIMKYEDDIVEDFVLNQLENERNPDARKLQ